VNQHADEFSRELLCAVVGLPRSTSYYQAQPADDLDLRSALEEVALKFPRYGYRRMTAELQRRRWVVNHKRVLRLMREEHLLVQVRRFCRTTFSQHPYGRYPNLIKHLVIARPDQVWCGDITYIRLRHESVYLAVLLDIFTRSIRGWELSRQLSQELPKAALQRALRSATPEMHHSDQGVQYAADGYTALLRATGVQISMSAQGQPTENAYAERFIRTLKEEEVYLHEYQDFADARTHIGRFLDDVYMHKRVHSALGYLPPAEFETLWRATERTAMKAAEPSTPVTKRIS
jgi:transposase InsO family protein